MRYLILMYGDESDWANATPEERDRIIEQHYAGFPKATAELGVTIVGGEALQTADTSTRYRRRGDEVEITDGPYAETVEQLGGYYLVDAPDLDSVLKSLAALPEYTFDVRPVDPMPGAS